MTPGQEAHLAATFDEMTVRLGGIADDPAAEAALRATQDVSAMVERMLAGLGAVAVAVRDAAATAGQFLEPAVEALNESGALEAFQALDDTLERLTPDERLSWGLEIMQRELSSPDVRAALERLGFPARRDLNRVPLAYHPDVLPWELLFAAVAATLQGRARRNFLNRANRAAGTSERKRRRTVVALALGKRARRLSRAVCRALPPPLELRPQVQSHAPNA